jgi:hypothetical protein
MTAIVKLKRPRGAILRSVWAGREWSGYMTRPDLEREREATRERTKERRKQKAAAATSGVELPGSESKDVDMAAYIRAAEVIRDAFDCLVIIVHHCGWDESRPRGHSSLPGVVDVQLRVERHENSLVVEVELMRDGPEGTRVNLEAQEVVGGWMRRPVNQLLRWSLSPLISRWRS